MVNSFNKTVEFIQFLTGKTQGDIAESIGYTRSHFNVLLGKGDNPDIQKLLLEKYKPQIDEFFSENQLMLNEDQAPYTKAKIVDAELLLVHDSLQIKAMLRVLLRNQATILAAQQKISLKKVLLEMTRAVRTETSEEFDEL